MATDLVRFETEEGLYVYVEVGTTAPGGVRPASKLTYTVNEAKKTLEKVLEGVLPIAQAISRTADEIAANEVEVEFGVNLSAEYGVIVSSASIGANYKVTLKWKEKSIQHGAG